jgi:hypothetical protein
VTEASSFCGSPCGTHVVDQVSVEISDVGATVSDCEGADECHRYHPVVVEVNTGKVIWLKSNSVVSPP